MTKITRTLMFVAAILYAGTCQGQDADTVAVIGTGDMGDTMGPRFASLGYRVVYGSRTPNSDKVKALVASTGHGAIAAAPMEAAQQGEIVMLLVPWPAMEQVAQSLGNLDGKLIIDVSMPFVQGEDGYPEHMFASGSSAQRIQAWNPGAKVVKTFGTMGSYIIDEPDALGETVSMPIASDDKAAKERVAGIVAAIGLDPVDFGPLRMARDIEILQMIYMIPLVQNRAEHWEFRFLRGDHYRCYTSFGETPEGITPPYDSGNLANFPHDGESLPDCPPPGSMPAH